MGEATPTTEQLLLQIDRLQQRLACSEQRCADLEAERDRSRSQCRQERADREAAARELETVQQRLLHTERMASLGALSAGIAHEIKNPLNFVTNFAELLEELTGELHEALARGEAVDDLVADLRQNAAVVVQHSQRADRIIKSIMTHARSGSGTRAATDLNGLVREYVDLAYHGQRVQVPGLCVQVDLDLDEAVGVVEVVPQDLGRVLLNLIGNAFDAVQEAAARRPESYTPRVAISTRQRTGRVEVRVGDNGPGIPAAIRDRVFEPFFTTKPVGSGTGLGLSLSHDIVTQGHGGSLVVESEAGRGTTFIVTLPTSVPTPPW